MESIETVVKEILVLEEQGRVVVGEAAETTAGLNEQKSEHMMELVLIDREMAVRSAPYEKTLDEITNQIEYLKGEIAGVLIMADQKTVELDFAKVQMTTTKSVKIINKIGLVDVLTNIKDGIDKGVKSFALPHIRKLMEVGAVTSVLAEFEISRRVKITAKEPELTAECIEEEQNIESTEGIMKEVAQ